MTVVEKLRFYAGLYQDDLCGRAVEGTEELLVEAAEHIEALNGRDDRDAVFRMCICAYGSQAQGDMMIEEMIELTKALLKWRRAKGAELTAVRNCIIDELADVRIMARQMEILFQAEEEVERKIDFKVKRQADRLKELDKQAGSGRRKHAYSKPE